MHVGIIMDGNGRWATQKGLSRLQGHAKGLEQFREIALFAAKTNIRYLTVYAFSIQNWHRPKTEIRGLFHLVRECFQDIRPFQDANIRLRVQGFIDIYPADILNSINKALHDTAQNTGMVLTIALSYGGREEIMFAVDRILQDQPSSISMESINSYINPDKIPDPDLIIRTSGEFRTSNFLLWQSAYAEYYITNTLWPDFTCEELYKALSDFQTRDRRFGKIKDNAVIMFEIPEEQTIRDTINGIFCKAEKITTINRVKEWTTNIPLRMKYTQILESILLEETSELSEQIAIEAEAFARSAIPDKSEEFFEDLRIWTDWVFYMDWVVDSNNIKSDVLSNIVSEHVGIVDIYRSFQKHLKGPSKQSIEESIKQKLYGLTDTHIQLYSHIARNDIESDYTSRILIFFYGIYPILRTFMTIDQITNTSILMALLDDIEDGDSDRIPNIDLYHLFESVLESFATYTNPHPLFAKMKAALIYLIHYSFKRFIEKKSGRKITFTTVFRYLRLVWSYS